MYNPDEYIEVLCARCENPILHDDERVQISDNVFVHDYCATSEDNEKNLLKIK